MNCADHSLLIRLSLATSVVFKLDYLMLLVIQISGSTLIITTHHEFTLDESVNDQLATHS